MNLNSTCIKLNGEVKDYARIRFFDIKANSFSYTWESSTNQKNWTTYALIKAVRRVEGSVRPNQDIAVYSGDIPKESHQYDFLIGNWNIVKTLYDIDGELPDKQVGKWWAKPLHGGRAIHDDRVYVNDNEQQIPDIQSLRTYSPKLKKWNSLHVQPLKDTGLCVSNQTWLTNEMVGLTTCVNHQGEALHYTKTHFKNITDNSFTYTEELSKDNENWTLISNIQAEREPG